MGVNGAIQSHPRTDITRRIPTYPGGPVFFHDSDGVQDVQMTDLFGAPWYLCRLKGADPRRRFVESNADVRRSAILTPLQFDPGLFPNYAPWHALALEPDLLAGRYGLAGWDGMGYDSSINAPRDLAWWDRIDWDNPDTYYFAAIGIGAIAAGVFLTVISGGAFLAVVAGGALSGFGMGFGATGMATGDWGAALQSGAIGAAAGAVGGAVGYGVGFGVNAGLQWGITGGGAITRWGINIATGAAAGATGGLTGGFTGGTLGGLAAGQSWDEALRSGAHAGLQGAKWGAAIGAAVPLVAGGTRLAYRWAASRWAASQLVSKNKSVLVGQIEYGSSDLSQEAIAYRRLAKITTSRNVSVFEYEKADDLLLTITRASDFTKGHAERLVAAELEAMGVRPEQVARIYSELQPCVIPTPASGCATFISKTFPQAKVTWSFEYGATRSSRQAGVAALKRALKRLGF